MNTRKLILVVDGYEPRLILLHQVLTRFGYDVVLAATPDEAAAQAIRHRPDLLLLASELTDERQPGLAQRLARDERTASIPVFLAGDGGSRAPGGAADTDAPRMISRGGRLGALLDAVRRSIADAGPAAWDVSAAPATATG